MKKATFLISVCLVYFVGFSQNTNCKLFINKDESNSGLLRYDLSLNDEHISSSTQSSDLSEFLSDSVSICLYFQNLNEEELHIATNNLPEEMVLKVKEIYLSFSSLETSVDVATLLKFKNVELLSFQDPSIIDVKPNLLLLNIEELCKLENIVSLSLSNTNVNQSFKICCFKNLKYLDVSFSNIDIEEQLLKHCSGLKHIIYGNSNNKIVSDFIYEITKHPALNELTLIVQTSKQIQLISSISGIEKMNLVFGFPISEKKLDETFVSLSKIENLKSLHIKANSKKRGIVKIPESIQILQDIEELSIDFPLSEIDNLSIKKLKLLRLYSSNSHYLQDGQLESFKKRNPDVEIIIENDVFKLSTPVN